MKKVIFGLIATVLMSVSSFGQETINLTRIIPVEVKGSIEDAIKEGTTVSTIRDISKKWEATFEFSYYLTRGGEYKFTSMSATTSNAQTRQLLTQLVENGGCPDGYRACARGCNDKPTELGVILCIGYCMIDCL